MDAKDRNDPVFRAVVDALVVSLDDVFASVCDALRAMDFYDRVDDPEIRDSIGLNLALSAHTLRTGGAPITRELMATLDEVIEARTKIGITNDLVAEQKANPRDLSTMELLWLAAAPVATPRLAEAVDVLGPWIGQSFGQAEAPGFITWMTPEDLSAAARSGDLERLASCGRPTWGTQVAIMDIDGNLLPTDETGEIVVRGRLVTPGYHNLPEKTAEVRQHGWHHTGDIGRIDADGFVYIMDRLKDMVISGGFNVYPSEVEAAMMQLPGVAQCAVIGVPHDRWGEEVTAIVVPTADSDRDAGALVTGVSDGLCKWSVSAKER